MDYIKYMDDLRVAALFGDDRYPRLTAWADRWAALGGRRESAVMVVVEGLGLTCNIIKLVRGY